MLIKISKIVFACLIAFYILWFSTDPLNHYFFHSLNLVIHEAGHTLFSAFGEYIQVFGGSFVQILLPLIFALYFYHKRLIYSGSIVMMWFAGSLFDIQIYIKDAIKMELPLLGGDSSIHDWNYILSRMNILNSTDSIASFVYFISLLVLGISFITACYYAFNNADRQNNIL